MKDSIVGDLKDRWKSETSAFVVVHHELVLRSQISNERLVPWPNSPNFQIVDE